MTVVGTTAGPVVGATLALVLERDQGELPVEVLRTP